MAHVEDRWFQEVVVDGKKTKIKTARHGTGLRFRARWNDPNGAERSQSFRLKGEAERKITAVEGDKLRGTYVDPRAGRITLREYGQDWLEAQTFDENTRRGVEIRLRVHVYPHLGDRAIGAIRPSHIQSWLRGLQNVLAASTIKVVFTNLSTVLNAAVDDDRIAKNPCKAPTVQLPKADPRKVVPWTHERVENVRKSLPQRYQAAVSIGAGVGLRQGEVFGLAVEDIDFLGRMVQVRRQVKAVQGTLVFALPKGRKIREVTLAEDLAMELSAHLADFPAVPVTLPWEGRDGEPATFHLVLTTRQRTAVNAHHFNADIWKPALERAGVPPTRENGMHALRHWFASALLDGGESIKVVSEFLGHTDEGFTLRTYTHLMPDSRTRARGVLDSALRRTRGSDGPATARTAEG